MKTTASLLAVVALLFGLLQIDSVRWSIDGDFVESEGAFLQKPAGRGQVGIGSRFTKGRWMLPNGGRLIVGPFLAPPFIEVNIAASSGLASVEMFLRDVASNEEWRLESPSVSEETVPQLFAVPAGWHGRPVTLHLENNSRGETHLAYGGIHSVPGWAFAWRKFGAHLCEFLFLSVLALVFLTVAAWTAGGLAGNNVHLALLLSCASVSLAAFGIMWLFFANATLGVIACWSTLIAAVVLLVRRIREHAAKPSIWQSPDWWIPASMMIAAGVFYVAGLHLFSTDAPMSHLAQWRFTNGLPPDNILPQVFARRLALGDSLVPFRGDWQAVDRPPLQAGWILFFAENARIFGIDHDTAAQSSGILFQLSWIPAVWALVRSVGVTQRVASCILLAIIPTGFLFLNSVYTWPKLAGGGVSRRGICRLVFALSR